MKRRLLAALSAFVADDHPHKPARLKALLALAGQAPKAGALLIGDSRAEKLYLPEFAGQAVLNAGIGGTNLAWWRRHLPDLLAAAQPATVIVSLGVNDAQRNRRLDIEGWQSSYRELVRSLDGRRKVLVSIFPVEQGKPLGARYFDPERIDRMNAVISRVARETGAQLVEPPSSVSGLTIEGVHFTQAGNRVLAGSILQAA